MVNCIPKLLYTWRKSSCYPLEKEAGWAPRVGMDNIKKKFDPARNLLFSYLA
jgi:hypothetical protein